MHPVLLRVVSGTKLEIMDDHVMSVSFVWTSNTCSRCCALNPVHSPLGVIHTDPVPAGTGALAQMGASGPPKAGATRRLRNPQRWAHATVPDQVPPCLLEA